MKNKLLVPVLTIPLLLIYIQFIHPAVQTITYFPPDLKKSYTYAYTELRPPVDASMEGRYRIDWTTVSMSADPLYLRQDVSLLFRNGCLSGAQSSWKRNTAAIKMTEYPSMKGDNMLDAITFHHGEAHSKEDRINAVQTMSRARLYVETDSDRPFTVHSFSDVSTSEEAEFKKKIDSSTKQKLLYYWNNLASELNIDMNDYISIPLTSLSDYENEPLPGLSMKETKATIGKLWEGLYKQYIIKILTDEQADSCMPLILFKRDNKQLQVIYELNGRKAQLIQKVSN